MWPHISSDEAHRIAFGFSPPDDPYFATRLRDRLGERGRTPRRSRTERQQRAWKAADQVGFGPCRAEPKANTARRLTHAAGDFKKNKLPPSTRPSRQAPDFWTGSLPAQHAPTNP